MIYDIYHISIYDIYILYYIYLYIYYIYIYLYTIHRYIKTNINLVLLVLKAFFVLFMLTQYTQ